MAVKFKDYYKTLGVARDGAPEEIKAAFRKLARKYHPDVAKDKKTAEEKFKEINEANEVLSDPEKRRRYDELGANWDDPGAGRNGARRGASSSTAGAPDFEFGGTGFSDFFETFFGGQANGFGSSRRGFPRGGGEDAPAFRGEDIEADILVSLSEALKGSVRKVTLRRPASDEPERLDTYQVRIPAGVYEGQRIRLGGQGWKGQGGASAGDLYLRARLARHPDFSVEGSDLNYELDLAPWEGVLGIQVRIPTLDGATTLRVPPGTAAGTRLRLRGLGLPRADGSRGDLYAVARIQIPNAPSDEERKLWENLSRTSSFKPRGAARA